MKFLILCLIFMHVTLTSKESIVIHIEKNIQDIGSAALEVFQNELDYAHKNNLTPVFILPTGSTPIPFYKELVHSFYEGKLDLSRCHFFNLDEYVGLDPRDPNSYYYYMNTHLYAHLSPKLSYEKLRYFGLCELDSESCSSSKKRLQLNQLIDEFSLALIEENSQNSNTTEVLETVVSRFRKKNRLFKYLEKKHLNDNDISSIKSLKTQLENDISLRIFHPKACHIHRLNGKAPDLLEEIKNYQQALSVYLNKPNSWVTCFAGIGTHPAHIAFNDFETEPYFRENSLSKAEKNKLALNSETRLITLSSGTKKVNSRFFNSDISLVPSKALTLGFKEVLSSNRLIILASGLEKKRALFDTFSKEASFEVPSSLLRYYDNGKLSFLVDEKSYGLGEANSLFSLDASNKQLCCNLSFQKHNTQHYTLWDIPKLEKGALLYKGQNEEGSKINYASVPKNKKVLWITSNKVHYPFWKRLKINQNKITLHKKINIESIIRQVSNFEPEVILLPYSQSVLKLMPELKSFINQQFDNKLVLGIFYDIGASLSNVHLPLTKKHLLKKREALKTFHKTQSNRSHFDLIVKEMAQIENNISPYIESYTFFKLQRDKEIVRLIPFPKSTLIKPSQKKNNKFIKHSIFSFKKTDLVLSISPHPDDSEIGIGGLMMHLAKEKIPLVVLNATSGNRAKISTEDALQHFELNPQHKEDLSDLTTDWVEDKVLKSKIRACESEMAVSYLYPSAKVQSLNLPFYEKGSFSETDRSIIDKALIQHLQHTHRLIVFMPHPNDQHPTHQKTHQIFKERILYLLKKMPHLEVFLAYYSTPWTGQWNLYDYSAKNGSKLSALIGAEQLTGHGQIPPSLNDLGGDCARKYQVFYFNN